MNLNIQIPDNTALIFEYMQKGQFICSNSTDIDLRDMYNICLLYTSPSPRDRG